MKLRSILPVSAFIALAASSCTPYVEPVPETPADPAKRTVSSDDQQKIKERREKLKQEEEAAKRAESGSRTAEKPKEKADGGGTAAGGSDTTKPKSEKPASYPVAVPIPGKPGFVLSPFNSKPIDVKDIPSGKLVADPTYPASEKKYFRVP